MKASHTAEVDKVRADTIAAAKRKHNEKVQEKLRAQSETHLEGIRVLEENLKTAHSVEIDKLNAEHANEKSEMIRKHEESLQSCQNGIASNEGELATKDAEIERLQSELKTSGEEKRGLEQKASKALAIGGKIKKAAGEKLKAVSQQHEAALKEASENAEAEAGALKAEINDLMSALDAFKSKHDSAVEELAELKMKGDVDEKIKSISQEHDAKIDKLIASHEEAMEKLMGDHKSKLNAQIKVNETNKEKVRLFLFIEKSSASDSVILVCRCPSTPMI